MKQKWSAGKIIAMICGGMAAVLVLVTAFCIDIVRLTRSIASLEAHVQENQDESILSDDFYADDYVDDYADDFYADEGDDDDYYEFHNAVNEEISYWVEFETYDRMTGENENITLHVIYPVFYSEAEADMEAVNQAVQKELQAIQDYADSVSDWLAAEEEFVFEAECYVTYMDEELLSVAYEEYGYLNGEFYESYVISVNIDMDTKMTLTNSQILDIDDDFSIDFRNRSEKQNGEIDSLYYYSDQDITEFLTTEESLILFYTPLGMEVGFNYSYGWVTVTYPDYLEYQRKF